MTFTHAGSMSICDSCGDFIETPFGLVIVRFERDHVCGEVAA